jgi:Ca2+-transporting ATPase
MEQNGYRVLGFAFRDVKGNGQKEAESALTLAGFIGMIDPPRAEVYDSIMKAKEAGVDIKVITGDSALTARAVSGKLGIEGGIIEGDKLVGLKEKGWNRVVRENVIFARVTPEQKFKIVDTLKKQGQVVGVTGDGVNDILALKRADIGISMGERGTDVARESSDIILLDDNFSSIVSAIHQGRRIFSNLKKSTKFLLATNFAHTFIIMTALFADLPLPLLPLAILWINLFTDSFPALALGLEPAEDGIMKKSPENGDILGGIWKSVVVAGLLNFVSVMAVFVWSLNLFGVDVARTMVVSIIVFYTMFFSLSCKSDNVSVFKSGIFNNKYLILAIVFSITMHLIAIYTVLGSIFGFVPLTMLQLGVSVATGLIGFAVFEIWKLLHW